MSFEQLHHPIGPSLAGIVEPIGNRVLGILVCFSQARHQQWLGHFGRLLECGDVLAPDATWAQHLDTEASYQWVAVAGMPGKQGQGIIQRLSQARAQGYPGPFAHTKMFIASKTQLGQQCGFEIERARQVRLGEGRPAAHRIGAVCAALLHHLLALGRRCWFQPLPKGKADPRDFF
ncbi:hypothetical protein D3C75_810360 [compost metagenome]